MIQKSDHDMVNKINAASHAAMAGVIARARLRNATLVVSKDGEAVLQPGNHLGQDASRVDP